MNRRIINYIRAGYPGLYLISHEEQRVNAEMIAVANELKYSLFFWSVADGLIDPLKAQQVKEVNDPLEALIAVQELKEQSIVLLKDFHLFLADPNPILIRQFKDVCRLPRPRTKP